MKNYNLLKEIALCRRTGYTTAIEKLDSTVRIAVSETMLRNSNRKDGRFVSCSMDLKGKDGPVIPDNSLLYAAIVEAEEYIKQLEQAIQNAAKSVK